MDISIIIIIIITITCVCPRQSGIHTTIGARAESQPGTRTGKTDETWKDGAR